MSDTKTTLQLLSIEKAAKELKVERRFLRKICIAAGIVIRAGGTEKKPRLRVNLPEAERVVLSQQYVPADAPKGSVKKRPKGPIKNIHRLVRC